MADLERIAPPVPTLPTPIGRNVDPKRRRLPEGKPRRGSDPGSSLPPKTESDHIDEYV
jgi:hypothetical protein